MGLFLGGALTIFWGRVYVEDVRNSISEQFVADMNSRARVGRVRLDNYVKLHHYTAELFITQKKFIDYIRKKFPQMEDEFLI